MLIILDEGEKVLEVDDRDCIMYGGELKSFDIADAVEKRFWEMSYDDLERAKKGYESCFANKPKIRWSLVSRINKVVSQRKFIQNNRSLRESLLPVD